MMEYSYKELHNLILDIPAFDIHTHLTGGMSGAQGLHDIILYHMAISDLYAAGCPSGKRLTEYPGWPDIDETSFRIKEAIPYLKYVKNTSITYGINMILRDLYNWNESIDFSNWEKLDELIREKSNNKVWQKDIMKKAKILRYGTELSRRRDGSDDDIFQYSLEWGFFTRAQWGEYDTALYELEKCWGKIPGTPTPIGTQSRPIPDKEIKSINDVHNAISHYVNSIPYKQILATATHISTDIDFIDTNDSMMEEALKNRSEAGINERNIYASYINDAFLTALENHNKSIVFQFSFGAEPLPYETGSRIDQKTIAQLASMISKHPKIQFQCFLSNMQANQSMCTLCRELPNLSLAGYWWHNFFPVYIRQVIKERLNMLPMNKQLGFFSDAYCIEWTYAKSMMVRLELSKVLSEMVDNGYYTIDLAIEIAHEILHQSPKSLLKMEEAI